MKLIISGVGKRNHLIRLIKNEVADLNIDLVGCDSDPFPPARIEFTHFQKILRANESGFIGSYTSVFDKDDDVAVITLIDPEIPILGRIQMPGKVRVFHPDVKIALLCEDKYEFSISAKLNGIGAIETSLEPLIVYPFICKDRRGSAASGFEIIDSEKNLEKIKENKNLIFQPYCRGKHFCVDAYVSYYSGRLIDICIKEVITKSKGESYVLRSINSQAIVNFVDKICNWIPLKGIVNFDIYEEDGKLKLMEVNCRIGGNYPASHAFGCNLIKPFTLEVASGKAVAPKFSNYESNQIISKYFTFSNPVPGDLLGI